jgi:hypothetical protein
MDFGYRHIINRRSVYYEETTEIKLVIAPTSTKENELTLQFKNLNGTVDSKAISVGQYIGAVLSAPADLTVKANNDVFQEVYNDSILFFTRFVTPLKVSTFPIRLDILTRNDPNNNSASNASEVMQDEWVVEARGPLLLIESKLAEISPFAKNMSIVCGGLGAIGGIVFWKRKPKDSYDDEKASE